MTDPYLRAAKKNLGLKAQARDKLAQRKGQGKPDPTPKPDKSKPQRP